MAGRPPLYLYIQIVCTSVEMSPGELAANELLRFRQMLVRDYIFGITYPLFAKNCYTSLCSSDVTMYVVDDENNSECCKQCFVGVITYNITNSDCLRSIFIFIIRLYLNRDKLDLTIQGIFETRDF